MNLAKKIRRGEFITQKDLVVIKREFTPKKKTLEGIAEIVCRALSINLEALKAKNSKRELVIGRQIFSYLAREYTGSTFKTIGSFIGLDHSTISYSVKKIRDNRDLDIILKKYYYDVERELK